MGDLFRPIRLYYLDRINFARAQPLKGGSHQYIKEQIIEPNHLHLCRRRTPSSSWIVPSLLVWQSLGVCGCMCVNLLTGSWAAEADNAHAAPTKKDRPAVVMVVSVGELEIMMINGIKNGDFLFIIWYKPDSCTQDNNHPHRLLL